MAERQINPQKIKIVDELKDKLQDSKSLLLVDYKGISVKEDTELRKNLRKNNVDYFICKNRLLKIAVNDLGIKQLDPYLVGPTAVASSKKDELSPAKTIAKFTKNLAEEKNILKFKAGIVNEIFMSPVELKKLVDLPSKEELLTKVVVGLNSPISGFVICLTSILRKFVFVLNAIKETKTSTEQNQRKE